METLQFTYSAQQPLPKRGHVGVVGSGDLEVLMQPSADKQTKVTVRTSVQGFNDVWTFVLQRFFDDFPYASEVSINDFGATPGVVSLRLQQIKDQVQP